MKFIPLLLLSALPLSAVTITQWNFNSNPADTMDSTGTTLPSIGSGTASLRSTTSVFANGNAGTGSSDPTTTDDSGWGVLNFPASASGTDMTAGVQFLVDTTGYDSITVNYDVRHSNSSSRYQAVQYTLNGSLWTTATFFTAATGDTWYNNRTVNLSSISGAANNPNFGIRIVAASQFAATGSGSTGYVASDGGTFAATSNWRFDMVTVSGNVIPEPSAALLGGIGALALLRRRRR